MITLDQLEEIFPNGKIKWFQCLIDNYNDILNEHDIDTRLRVTHFLAQCAQETGGYIGFDEDPHHRISDDYEGNIDLGNSKKGDGYLYRGRGPIQLTGRSNYEWIGGKIGVDLISNPDKLLEPLNGWLASAAFWKGMKINKYADMDSVYDVTKHINGGINGLHEREEWTEKLKRYFF